MADSNIRDRLRSLAFNRDEARDALRGKAVPVALGRRVTRLCVIRGIRYHEEFADHPDLQQFRPHLPEFSRAMNARAIMSNKVPSMPEEQDRPYCIWHPQVASQDTYRKLWQQYPDMSYQVARACAVANYVELYREMDLLPDVFVADEGRASGSMKIFEAIMRNPVRYRVMNDYTRDVTLQNPEPGCLNDDTALLSTLDIKQALGEPIGIENEPITEFETYDEHKEAGAVFDALMPKMTFFTTLPEPRLNYLHELLYQPLPADLPPGNKDVLTLMAAYYGNIERYAKLRRPCIPSYQEVGWLVRGFASRHVRSAIHARMIMNNDLSRVIDLDTMQPFKEFEDNMPYLIWFPNEAQPNTYKALASAVPRMRPALLHGAVYLGDKDLFDWLLDDLSVGPTPYALQAAHDSYFSRRLKARSEELGIDLYAPVFSWELYPAKSGRSDNALTHDPTPNKVYSGMDDWGFYDGYTVDASAVELFASAPKSWRPDPDQWRVELDYEEWPNKVITRE